VIEPKRPNQFHPQWYWVTRTVGIFTAMYGLLIDKSPERGTIILAGFGLAGFDFAARKDSKTTNSG
jgi:hypothetical protein